MARQLFTRPPVTCLVYGLFLFAVMNLVVVPLSNAFPGRMPEGWMPEGWMLLGALFAHIVLVVSPFVYAARYYLATDRAPTAQPVEA